MPEWRFYSTSFDDFTASALKSGGSKKKSFVESAKNLVKSKCPFGF